MRTIWHNGYLPDRYSALVLKVPDRGLTLILLANSDALSSPFRLAEADIRTSPFGCAFLRSFVFDHESGDDPAGCDKRSRAMIGEWRQAHRTSAHRETTVDPQLVASYAGAYEIRPGTVLTLVAHGSHIVREQAGSDLEFFPESPTDFFAKRSDAFYSFERNSTGAVTLKIKRDGQEIVAKKVEVARAPQDTLLDLQRTKTSP